MDQEYTALQITYWTRRLAGSQALPARLPVQMAAVPAAAPAIALRGERDWTLPSDLPANWLGELTHAL